MMGRAGSGHPDTIRPARSDLTSEKPGKCHVNTRGVEGSSRPMRKNCRTLNDLGHRGADRRHQQHPQTLACLIIPLADACVPQQLPKRHKLARQPHISASFWALQLSLRCR